MSEESHEYEARFVNPSKSFLYFRIKAAIEKIDKRCSARTLGNPRMIASTLADFVFAQKQGVHNCCPKAGPKEQGARSLLGVAWCTRRDGLHVYIKGYRRDFGSWVFGSDETPLKIIFRDKMDELEAKRQTRIANIVGKFVGKEPAQHTNYAGRYAHPDSIVIANKWCMLIRRGNDFIVCVPGHVYELPDFMEPGKPFWSSLGSTEEKINRCLQYGKEAGYLPMDPLDDMDRLLENIEGREEVLNTIKGLMSKHGISLEELQ